MEIYLNALKIEKILQLRPRSGHISITVGDNPRQSSVLKPTENQLPESILPEAHHIFFIRYHNVIHQPIPTHGFDILNN